MPKSDAPGLGRRPAFEVLSSWCDRLCIRFASNLCVWDLALLVLAIHGHVGFCCKVGHVILTQRRFVKVRQTVLSHH